MLLQRLASTTNMLFATTVIVACAGGEHPGTVPLPIPSDSMTVAVHPVLPALPDAPALTMAVVRIIAADGPNAGARLVDNRYPIAGTTAIQPNPLAWSFLVPGVMASRAVVELELRSGEFASDIEWSVRSDTFAIARGTRLDLRPALGRGPLANLLAKTIDLRTAYGDTVNVGEGEYLVATLDGAYPGGRVGLHSLDPRIAIVRDGMVRGVAVGEARIVALAGLLADTIRVVVNPPVVSLRGEASMTVTSIGDTVWVPALATDAAGHNVPRAGRAYSVSDTTVLRPIRDGGFQALRAGETTVDVRLVADSSLRVTTTVIVRPQPVQATLTPSSGVLWGIGRAHALTATARDRRGNPIAGLAWKWSATGPATLTPGTDPGTATLVASAPGDVAVTASAPGATPAATYLLRPVITALAISPARVVLAIGARQQLTARIVDDRGATYPVPVTVRWTSLTPAVAAVDANGMVEAREYGSATVVATADSIGFSATAAVEVPVAPPASIEKLVGDGQVVPAGSLAPVAPSVRVRDADGKPMPGRMVAWTAEGWRYERYTDAQGISTFNSWNLFGKARSVPLIASVPGTSLSTTFTATVVAGPATMAGILVQPSDSAISGVPFARQPVAELHDEYGNPVHLAGETVWLTIWEGPATLGGTTSAVTDAQGIARFTNVSIVAAPGTYRLSYNYGSWGLGSTPIVVH